MAGSLAMGTWRSQVVLFLAQYRRGKVPTCVHQRGCAHRALGSSALPWWHLPPSTQAGKMTDLHLLSAPPLMRAGGYMSQFGSWKSMLLTSMKFRCQDLSKTMLITGLLKNLNIQEVLSSISMPLSSFSKNSPQSHSLYVSSMVPAALLLCGEISQQCGKLDVLLLWGGWVWVKSTGFILNPGSALASCWRTSLRGPDHQLTLS